MSWTARSTTRTKRRSRANALLTTLTFGAMGIAAITPTDVETTARFSGSIAQETVVDVALPEHGEIRPAPVTRSPLDRHAEVPPASTEALPPVMAETAAQADMRVADDRVVGVPPLPPAPAPEPAPGEPASLAFPEGPSRLFASRGNVNLYTPSADPVYIGFHEAAFNNAISMLPLGEVIANDNAHKYAHPGRTPTGQRYAVMSSRGRSNHATTAADIVMRPGEPVRSVVTGTVIEISPYALYGKYPDAKVVIRSAEDPSVVVTMLHLTTVRVNVGQEIHAGETIVADSGTSFPFLSQIDYYLGAQPNPHVHVEMKHG